MEEVWPAVIGAIAALSGVALQSIVSNFQEGGTRRRELLIDAYADYLTGLAKVGKTMGSEASVLLVSGKQKIAAYAPVKVVAALAAVEDTSLDTSQPDTQSALVMLVQAMRTTVGENLVRDADVARVLFGREPS